MLRFSKKSFWGHTFEDGHDQGPSSVFQEVDILAHDDADPNVLVFTGFRRVLAEEELRRTIVRRDESTGEAFVYVTLIGAEEGGYKKILKGDPVARVSYEREEA